MNTDTHVDYFLFFCFCLHLPRQIPHALPVRTFGCFPAKREAIDRRFTFAAFSFIVHGKGTYCEDGQAYAVQGPCMLRQWPGRQYRYGPRTEWEEFFVTYDPACLPQLDMPAWTAEAAPVIPLNDHVLLRHAVHKILILKDGLELVGQVDQVDQFFEALLLDAILSRRQPASAIREDRLQAARTWIEVHSTEPIQLEAVALAHGMAPRTFRRLWVERFGITPGHFLTGVRIRHACAMLANSHLPVAEIARQTGFNDPYYFSRRFHETTGIPPLAFRANTQAKPPPHA